MVFQMMYEHNDQLMLIETMLMMESAYDDDDQVFERYETWHNSSRFFWTSTDDDGICVCLCECIVSYGGLRTVAVA